MRAEIDLTASSLNLPWLGWRKGKGVDAGLSFAVDANGGETSFGDLALKGQGFSGSGLAKADERGLRSLVLRNLKLNPGDDVAVKVDRVQNGFTVAVEGEQFDARPLLANIRADLGKKAGETERRKGKEIDASVAFDRVVGFGGQTVAGFRMNYAGSGARIAALAIGGQTGGGPFSVDFSPRGNAGSIDVAATDAGALIDFAGAYPHMAGGRLSLSLLGSPKDGYAGRVEVRGFALVDEPRLSRLVAAPPASNGQSLSQAVGRELPAERATFDHASADIRFGKNGLRIANGIVRGPIFGSSFAGTLFDASDSMDVTGSFMPAYGINRVFGAIPVVGQILGNGREGGLIGITYRLSGKVAAPKLEVNPISAIAPGIFRNIFAYQ